MYICNWLNACIWNRSIWLISNLFLRPISFHPIQFIFSSKSIEIWISLCGLQGKNPFLWQEIGDPRRASAVRVCVSETGQWNTTRGVWGPSISSRGCWWHRVRLSSHLMTLKSSLTSSWHQVSIGWPGDGWWIDEWPDRRMDRQMGGWIARWRGS